MNSEQIIKSAEQLVTKIERGKGARAAGGAGYTMSGGDKETLRNLHVISKSKEANSDNAQKLIERAKANIGNQGSSLFETFENDSTNAGKGDSAGQIGQKLKG